VALDGSAEQPIPPAEFDALNPLVMVILNSLTFMNKSQISNESDALQGVCVGTAWFVSPEHAVTCWHVIEQGSDFFFTDFDGRKIQLSLVAKDEFSDLAVLRVINPKDASSNWLSLASGLPQVSDTVFTVGFPHPNLLGQQPKYTEGTITALSGLGDNQAYLQTTTPMQRGNSGGPLVNEAGEVVGIAAIKTMTLDEIADEKLQNVNFAVKVEKLVALLEKVGVTAAPPIGIKPISRRELFAEVRDAVILLQVR
jgi:S1-C subfamily serine protease